MSLPEDVIEVLKIASGCCGCGCCCDGKHHSQVAEVLKAHGAIDDFHVTYMEIHLTPKKGCLRCKR